MNHTPSRAQRPPPVIAVVDDDPLILETLEDLLESSGYTARTFSSAEALLQSDALSTLDCLISDIAMPGMDGVELQRRVWSRRPELCVLLMTGVPELVGKYGAIEANRSRVFVKPFDAKELLAAIAQAIA